MVEAVVGFVLNKLSDVITKELQLLGGVEEQVKQVKRELTRIQCCLKDADRNCRGDARVQNWLNELRDVAYRIEDATDTFFLEYEDAQEAAHKPKKLLHKLKPKKLLNKPKKLPILHNLGTELGNIQNELELIFKRRFDYGINVLPDKSKEEGVIMPNRRAICHDFDKTEVVGLHADRRNILKLLCAKGTPRRAVITIVGAGGLGKTTLAHMVYQSARVKFYYHIMLSISQQFSLTDLLRKMLRKLKNSATDSQDDHEYLIREIKDILSSGKYLIILDDVWEVDLWNQLKCALPDVKNGSRVLITSRSIDVAKSANSEMAPYELHFLDDKESQDLLLKKAIPNGESGERCPTELLGLAEKLSKKCDGLPLALIVLGGILSTKEKVDHAWDRVLRTMDWHSDGKNCMQVLAMSYEDMPYYLKACFLYLASFPQGDKISAKRLIRMWVAEGFLPQEQRKTMEEKAEDCLEELFQRSMVQLSSRCTNGSIKYFKVHDLLHDLAMHEARKENFVMFFTQPPDVKRPNKAIRRASLQNSPQAQQWNQQFTEDLGANIRSLLLFKFVMFPVVSKFRLLKVLELVEVTDYKDDMDRGLGELIHLKYLGFRNCGIPITRCSFHRMKSLETLDMRGTNSELPCNDLWRISTLRHVLFDGYPNGPKGTIDLRNLQTMRWVSAQDTWATDQLPHLNNLRKLGVRYIYNNWITVTNLLAKLPCLVSLGIMGSSLPEGIVYPVALQNYENLQSLFLDGKWSFTDPLQASSFPSRLAKLTLIRSQLEQDPMLELGKLQNLKKLCLRGDVCKYSGPTICPNGFPVLQYLDLGNEKIEILTVEKGVMPKLTYLKAPPNLMFHRPRGLQHVTIIKEKKLLRSNGNINR